MMQMKCLKLAACIEEHFPHSMAKAIVRAAKDHDLPHKEMHSDVEYVVAHGMHLKLVATVYALVVLTTSLMMKRQKFLQMNRKIQQFTKFIFTYLPRYWRYTSSGYLY